MKLFLTMMMTITDTSKLSCLTNNIGRSTFLFGIIILLCIITEVAHAQQQQQHQQQQCERLKTSLTYAQEDAPSDLSGVLPVIVERINRELDGVVDVEVNWKGSDFLKGTAKVGEHIIQCTVTRLAVLSIGDNTDATTTTTTTTSVVDGRTVTSQCYHIPFTITDTNECTLRVGHPMRHVCDERSTICLNTIGSYECVCPRLIDESVSYSNPIPGSTIANPEEYFTKLNNEDRGLWELSYKALSSCPSSASTYGCCRTNDCRASFVCPQDPCSRPDLNDCSQLAKCVRKATPTRGRSTTGMKDFTCKCPTGYMGNGHSCTNNDPQPQPKVMFDGVTPTEETLKNNLYCDCTVPIIDACAGFPPCEGKHQECVVDGNEPKCACKKGYMFHETYGCVDEVPPTLLLKHDPNKDKILRLKQGDTYTEYAVDIHDENAEEYLRSLKIAYSQPLPPKCLIHVGEFHVNYTIATPWTSPPYVRITRRVIIEDINECTLDVAKYKAICPELVPKCDPLATCINTIGSYKCQCPKYTSGDGYQKGIEFLNSNKPDGYISGQGCIDTTKPTIQIQGPNPKIFRVAECTGISSILQAKNTAPSSASSGSSNILSDKLDLKRSQQSYYNDDIKKLIKETSGAELCATFANANPDPTDCVYAYDLTPTGRVDLSRKVVIGDPIQKSSLRWSVPYNVNDEAGNAAETVWRDVIVEEVKLNDIENSIRKEALVQQKIEINKAVEKAVAEERKRFEQQTAARSRTANQRNTATTCPECPKCSTTTTTTTAKTESGSCPAIDEAACAKICKSTIESCAIDEKSFVIQLLLYLEKIEILNPSILISILFSIVAAVGLLVLRVFLSWIFNTDPYRTSYDNPAEVEERQRRLLESVQYYNTGTSGVTPLSSSNGNRDIFIQPTTPGSIRDNTVNGFIPPPRQSMSFGPDRGFLTPPVQPNGGSLSQTRQGPSSAPPTSSSLFGYNLDSNRTNSGSRINSRGEYTPQSQQANILDDIYEGPTTIITPSKRGDGVAQTRNSPY